MKTRTMNWTIADLVHNWGKVEFPEFQREPTIWDLVKKQRLIDSIIRRFDISSIYFHQKKNDSYDCIDGRQRLNAILSYLGVNDVDQEDNGFHLKMENEIYDDGNKFHSIQDKRYDRLPQEWKDLIDDYKLNIVIITEVEKDSEEELNLLFLRLQIASVLNAGEKLHAMTGEMRDWIFLDLKNHNYFKGIKLPTRRFAMEQVASQIVLNVFGQKMDHEFKRARFIDMQEFYKRFSKLDPEKRRFTKEIKRNLDIIVKHGSNSLKFIKNRAVAVSFYLCLSELIEQGKEDEVDEFIKFLIEFLKALKWQISMGVDIDREYHDLLKFQSYVSQAAGEKSAIEKRQDFLKDYFNYYRINGGAIKGDLEFRKRTRKKPEVERSKI